MGLGRHFGRPAVYQERLAVPLLPAPLGEVINVGTEGMMLGRSRLKAAPPTALGEAYQRG